MQRPVVDARSVISRPEQAIAADGPRARVHIERGDVAASRGQKDELAAFGDCARRAGRDRETVGEVHVIAAPYEIEAAVRQQLEEGAIGKGDVERIAAGDAREGRGVRDEARHRRVLHVEPPARVADARTYLHACVPTVCASGPGSGRVVAAVRDRGGVRTRLPRLAGRTRVRAGWTVLKAAEDRIASEERLRERGQYHPHARAHGGRVSSIGAY